MGQPFLYSFQWPNSPQQQNIQMHMPILPYHMSCFYWQYSELVFTNHRIPDFLSKVPDSVRNSHRKNGCGSNKDPCKFVLFYLIVITTLDSTPNPCWPDNSLLPEKRQTQRVQKHNQDMFTMLWRQSLLPCIVALVGSENRGMSKR